MSAQPDVSPHGVRAYAEALRFTWTEWSDEEVAEVAADAATVLEKMAGFVGGDLGEPRSWHR